MNVFLVSPYHSGSHEAWATGYAAASSHHVELITMTGRFWKWRMHGGPVTLAEQTLERIDAGVVPDVIVATDMVDLPSYLGLSKGRLDGVPVVMYCHENQFSYPVSPRSQEDLTFGAMNWKSMLVADVVVFNSEFHRAEVLEILPGFLKNFPDYRHLHLLERVERVSQVLPVGVDVARFAEPVRSDPPLILWAQRWEHDKNPEGMMKAIDGLAASGRSFRVAVAGENFRNEPEEFLEARDRWGDRLVHFGWAERDEYERLVRRTDIVLSTALHEFFGIAVVEALSAGAWAILPNRLSYPEILDPGHTQDHLYDDIEELAAMLEHTVDTIDDRRQEALAQRGYYERYDWSQVAPKYDDLFEKLVIRSR